MPQPVRVIGRIDLAEQIREALRSAGFDANVVTASPMSVYTGMPPAEGVDVAIATSVYDPSLWMIAKAKHPLRPMVAVAEQRRERALRGALFRRNGPDAYVTWPATPEELAAAIRRAESSASRTRSWSAADLGAGLLAAAVPMMGFAAGIGALCAGLGLLVGVRTAWNARWQAAAGIGLTMLGGGLGAVQLMHWLQLMHRWG